MRRYAIAVLTLALGIATAGGCNCGGDPIAPGDTPDAGNGETGSDAGQQSSACLEGIQALEVGPANQTATVSGPGAHSFTFSATATMSDGSRSDVSSRVAWSASRDDDTPPGTFSGNVYQAADGTGGVVTIKASDTCGHAATTTLTLKLEATFADPGPETTNRFSGTAVTSSATKTPSVVYPSDQTRFPRNIYKVLFQWKKGGNDAFRLTFQGPGSTVVVYTDGANPTCAGAASTSGCWEADTATWQAIAGSNAGATVTLTVDGVTSGDANVYRAAPITLGFSRRDVKGAIFYWSTTAAGVRRASVSDSAPEPYVVGKPTGTQLPDGNGTVACVACHTVSRSGKKMVAYTQAGSTGEFVYDVTVQSPPTPLITTQMSTQKGFGTFRPDDARVVATVGSLLKEFDASNGAKVADLPVPKGTNPDWSPTGAELVYSNVGGDSPSGAGLDVIAYHNGAWGGIRPLVPAAGQTNLFPSYSPDGAYVAYARGKGGHGDKTLQLWLVRADGSQAPVELVTANRVVNNTTTTGQYENNMPTWAPTGDFDWVAFNSLRPYGVVFPSGGTQQIWVAAIDKSKVGTGVDPSYPAFRFAFQNLNEDNHRAFWTLDVRVPDEGGPVCRPAGSDCTPDSASACCAGTECLPADELTYACKVPSDGGVCLATGTACSQTGGDACCQGTYCDVGADGGTVCQAPIIQ